MFPMSNLQTFVKTRPPLVIFMICLCLFAVVLLSLAYFIENNEVRDPDLSNDWNTFLTSFSHLRFCLAESPFVDDVSLLSPKLDLNLNKELDDDSQRLDSSDMNVKPAAETLTGKSSGAGIEHTALLSMTIYPTPDFLASHVNGTHLSGQIRGYQLGLSGKAAQESMNISFLLPSHMNHTKCSSNETCDPVTIQTCVIMTGSVDVFPDTLKPEVCEKPLINETLHETYIRGFKDYTLLKLYMCHQKTRIIVNYESQPSLTVMLSLHDRSLIVLHLMHTSCFLFVMVVTLLFYAIVRSHPTSDLRYHTTSQSI